MPTPLGKVIHTLGWPLRLGAEVPRVRRLVDLPHGRRHDLPGLRGGPRLRRRDALGARPAAGVQDPPVHPRRSSRAASGSPGAPRRSRAAASTGCRAACTCRARCMVGDSAGFVDMMALKGVHHAIHSGTLAAEAIYEALKAGKATSPAGLWGYTKRVRESSIWKELWKVRDIRPGLPEGLPLRRHGARHADRLVRARAAQAGALQAGRRGADLRGHAQRRATPQPDGQYIFDKLGSVFASGNQTRDDQPSHIRVQTHVPRRARHGLGVDVPGQGLRDRRRAPATAP